MTGACIGVFQMSLCHPDKRCYFICTHGAARSVFFCLSQESPFSWV